MKNEAKKFGENLKRIRNTKNISQGDIARALDVDKAFISNIEHGKTNPTLKTIYRLAKVLRVNAYLLLK